jgi:predicted nuclease of restriction endonuclease-like RecB superfamily
MLPSELLITRTRKDRIYPDFLPLNVKQLELARELIDVYQTLQSRKKSEINEILENLEQDLQFKRVRGLRTLLERRCTFTSKFTIEPARARRAVFETASVRKVTTEKERAAVIQAVAQNLNGSADELEQSLWADLDSEVILELFDPLTPEELIKKYNLSLAQTLLFKATGLTLTVTGKAPKLFRAIKYFGLMYLPEEGNKIRIEGASSLLKLSERYGTALAKLLPVIVRSESWTLDAEIVIRRDNTPRIYHFIMDSRDKALLMSAESDPEPAPTTFDSSVEQKFYTEFVALPVAKNWELIREPDVIVTKRGVFIPDFKFQHTELELETYFEIVGFWTETYIKRKLAKLGSLPFTMLVAINKNLACFNAEPFGSEVDQPLILYTKKVPVGDVIRYLTALEKEAVTKQVAQLKETEIVLEGDIIPIKELAHKYGMSQDAVRACVKDQEYVVFKEVIVKKELLSAVMEKLLGVEKYVDAREIIEAAELSNADEVLAYLGFTVTWRGLDVNEARIKSDRSLF